MASFQAKIGSFVLTRRVIENSEKIAKKFKKLKKSLRPNLRQKLDGKD